MFSFYGLTYCALFVVFILVYFLLHILQKDFDYWKKRNVPHASPVLFFGTVKDYFLGRLSFGEMVSRQCDAFPGTKLIGSFQSRWPEIIVRDPDLIKHVLIKDFPSFYFRDKQFHTTKLSNNLFHVNNESWKTMRQNLTPVFTSAKLKNMFHLILARYEEFNEYIAEKIAITNVLEFRDLMSRYTMDVIGSCAFGVDINSMKVDDNPFIEIGKLSFESGYIKTFRKYIQLLFPDLSNFLGIRVIGYKVEEFMTSFVQNVLTQRNHKRSTRNDLIDLLIDLKDQGSISGTNVGNDSDIIDMEVTDDFITAQVFVFFAAGFETSSTATSYALYELALNPEIQERLYEEITAVIDNHSGKITYDSIQEMEYLDKVLSESLRKYPPLSTLTRRCTVPYTFPGTDVSIDRDCLVTIPVLSLHYDPKYYPNPNVFDPERFTADQKKAREPCVYLPFGDGPRNCIGLRFAKVQSKIGLIAVLKNYKVEVSEKTDKEITYNTMSFITTPKNGLWLKVTKRQSFNTKL